MICSPVSYFQEKEGVSCCDYNWKRPVQLVKAVRVCVLVMGAFTSLESLYSPFYYCLSVAKATAVDGKSFWGKHSALNNHHTLLLFSVWEGNGFEWSGKKIWNIT